MTASKMELLNGLLFSLPGTPVLYYGDEIGMGDNVYPRRPKRRAHADAVEPQTATPDSRARIRRSLILPIIIDPEYHYEALNVDMQQGNSNSLLWWTKRLIALRKRYRAFGRGTVDFLHPSNPRVLAFVRKFENETILVVANLSRHVQFVELDLAAFDGMVPVELMGKTRFPTIGSTPYMLTLGEHDFYWFTVEAPRVTASDVSRPSLLPPIMLFCNSVETLLFGDERTLLDDALPTFLVARGLADGAIVSARVVETMPITRGDEPLTYVLVRVEYVDQEAESFAMPLVVVSEAPAGASLVAGIQLPNGEKRYLLEATTQAAAKVLVNAAVSGTVFKTANSRLIGGLVPGTVVDPALLGEPRVLGTDRLGATIAYGDKAIMKLLYRLEEGTEPELEVARFLQATLPPDSAPLVPRMLGYVERREGRGEPATLALLEEYTVNEGTAWQQARIAIGRIYEQTLTQTADVQPPTLPTTSILELSTHELAQDHAEAVGAYRDWALLLGKRTAELHLALSNSTDPAFAPVGYTTMDQRSKYQSARNLVGRVIGMLRRTITTLPANAQELGQRLLANESQILAKFEPLLHQRITSMQVRGHGNLHLGRALFTGKDFVLIGTGGGRDRRLTERHRKRGALRDVGSMVRSFHYAAALSLLQLRPEDQARAEPWGWVWQAWAGAAYVRGYLETAKGSVLVPEGPLLEVLLDGAIIEKAFVELRSELHRRPDMAWVPMQGILRMFGGAE